MCHTHNSTPLVTLSFSLWFTRRSNHNETPRLKPRAEPIRQLSRHQLLLPHRLHRHFEVWRSLTSLPA